MVTFGLLWLALVLQRLAEVARAGQNTRKLLQEGAREFAPGHYPVMVLVHVGWFGAWLYEVLRFGPSWHPLWLVPALAGQMLRAWAQSTMGSRWTTRILVFRQEQAVNQGPFRYFRHPNYLGVVLELFSFPMLFGAWRSALGASLANGLLLSWRIRMEEQAWKTFGS
jgi:methyltransferase